MDFNNKKYIKLHIVEKLNNNDRSLILLIFFNIHISYNTFFRKADKVTDILISSQFRYDICLF